MTKAPMLDPTDPADREKLVGEIRVFFADPSRKYKRELERRDSEIQKLSTEIAKLQKDSFKRSANFRLGITIIIFLALEGVVAFLANSYGEGPNLFQRLINSWPFLGIVVPVITLLIS